MVFSIFQLVIAISIHALLAESDTLPGRLGFLSFPFLSTLSLRRATYDTYAKVLRVNISIHALLAESDFTSVVSSAGTIGFLSTLSLRRATRINRDIAHRKRHFYPRSPCGERPLAFCVEFSSGAISIHALLAESDLILLLLVLLICLFLSTLSLRRATCLSIFRPAPASYFYPRSPCGERRRPEQRLHLNQIFLSTLSLRRATQSSAKSTPEEAYFYPRSPCGERRCQNILCIVSIYFYPRSPCGERRKI